MGEELAGGTLSNPHGHLTPDTHPNPPEGRGLEATQPNPLKGRGLEAEKTRTHPNPPKGRGLGTGVIVNNYNN